MQAIATEPPAQQQSEDLPSWNDGTAKSAIFDFVANVTSEPNLVDPKDRIAVFDNDGTLWGEYPIYFQKFFFDFRESQGLDRQGIGEDPETYIGSARDFVKNENSEEFGSPYVDLIYQPMVELLGYLRANDFQVFICSGGENDFVRGFAEEYYGIPPQNIVGSAFVTNWLDEDDAANPLTLVRTGVGVEPLNDEGGKPVGIERYIGKRPILAVGNSNGDLQMMEYTDDGSGNNLILLLQHDDPSREHYEEKEDAEVCVDGESYPPGSYCHTDKVLERVNSDDDDNWYPISVARDFNKVFLGSALD